MKRLGITADYPDWTLISEITNEMRIGDIEPTLVKQFPDLDCDFCFCFRCLNIDSGWSSKARMRQNKYDPYCTLAINNVARSSRTLGFEIIVCHDDFRKVENDIAAQRLLLGNEFWKIFKIALPKYKTKLPITNDEISAIFAIFEKWLTENNWI